MKLYQFKRTLARIGILFAVSAVFWAAIVLVFEKGIENVKTKLLAEIAVEPSRAEEETNATASYEYEPETEAAPVHTEDPASPPEQIDEALQRAINGDPVAQVEIAKRYWSGKDPLYGLSSVEWLRLAADQEHANAFNELGRAYEDGIAGIVEKNTAEAARLFEMGARLGSEHARNNLNHLRR